MQFIPFTPLIDIGFWTQLSKNKIEIYKLDDKERSMQVKTKLNSYVEKQSLMNLDIYSFDEEIPINKTGPLELYSKVHFQNYNTIEQYNNFDNLNYFQQTLQNLVEQYKTQQKPQLIAAKINIFADLKKYNFTYKFCVPQFIIENIVINKQQHLIEYLGDKQNQFTCQLQSSLLNHQSALHNSPFFIINSETFEYVEFNQAISTQGNYTILFFDAFNQEKFSASLTNLFAYFLENNSFKYMIPKIQLIVIKDLLSINAKQYNYKNSQFLEINLDKSNILSQNGNFKIFNVEGYLQEKKIDLKSFMDEESLAREAVDLNIKLMKWRLLPELDLDKIKIQNCLLIGAGTLGCQLARNLIGWGIRKITFVDYGKISYSNPVRQSLYEYEDSTGSGKPKAETAAQKLKKIFPDIQSEGYQINIPMPGHFVSEHLIPQTIEDLYKISELVKQSDAVFLLTDSRESRWLPTVLCNVFEKMCFSVALGFDSFLIIRHGISIKTYKPELHGDRLACYFCNDISSPGNSMKDRTLDQQCTVTRPGLSFLASAYASELFVSLVHSQLKDGTPASDDPEQLQQTDLGILPHFLRGQLSDFEVRLFYGKAFKNCVACSKQVMEAFEKNPEQFILEVLNRPDVLQDVSGITAELEQAKNEAHEIQEIEDDDCQVIQIL